VSEPPGDEKGGPARPVDPYIADNRVLWDEWTAIHETSAFYDLDGFRRGAVRLRPYEIEEVGPVEGRSLLHLQCHFGIDTLSWARLGARVTGADFSDAAVSLARRLADEIGFPEARFVRSELYELPAVLDDRFDVVYTSGGVLGWLPDIRRWAQVVAHFVKPGGRFYIAEIHPVAQALENEGVEPGELALRYPYWEHAKPLSSRSSRRVDRFGEARHPGQYPSDAQDGPPGASMSSTRTPWHDRGWMNATGPSAPRRGALSISSRPSISSRRSVSDRLATSKQMW
jgi:SAM-dependent methyltransferase